MTTTKTTKTPAKVTPISAAKTTTAKATSKASPSAPSTPAPKASHIKLAERPSGALPKSGDFQKAIVTALMASKAPVALKDLYDQVPKLLKLTPEQLAVESAGGELVWRQRTRAAATRMRSAGSLVQVGRGTWSLNTK